MGSSSAAGDAGLEVTKIDQCTENGRILHSFYVFLSIESFYFGRTIPLTLSVGEGTFPALIDALSIFIILHAHEII